MAFDFSQFMNNTQNTGQGGITSSMWPQSQKINYNPFGGNTVANAPSAGVTSGLESLVNSYNTAYGQAKSANEARYQQMLNIVNQTTNQRMSDVTSGYGQKASDIRQQFSRTGMGNTTIIPTMIEGNTRNMNAELNRTADTMQGTKLGVMERRTDAYPDLGSLQSILAGIGTSYGQGQGLSAMLKAMGGIKY